jgi:thiamine kinase-like enzyme
MEVLRRIHQSGVRVAHSFEIGKEISRYLDLCNERNAIRFTDYRETYEKMKVLIEYANNMHIPEVLCHIDSNPDNFIRLEDGSIRLVDWEYAGMGDPIMDISMYSIYSYYSKRKMDELLKIYLQCVPTKNESLRLYIYTALGGYLWALWAEYKQSFDVEFGDYGKKMYQYAKDFYDLLQQEYL